jgi:magnesium transporter
MLSYYKSTELGLVSLAEPLPSSWIEVIDPTTEDVASVQALGVPADFVTYPLDMDERARLEREDGVTLIVLRVPFHHGPEADIPNVTVPLGIILTDQFVITVCKFDHEILRDLSSGPVRGLRTGKRVRFVLYILLRSAKMYLRYLNEMAKIVDGLEDELQQSTRNRELLELLKYQKSLTFFATALKSNEVMIERLGRTHLFAIYPEDEDLLEDVITENRQAIEMCVIQSNILSNMMDAFASIISNNLNVVMKFLASVTIVLSLPTIIANFYGMNIKLPYDRSPFAFAAILLAAVSTTILAVLVFWWRDWF